LLGGIAMEQIGFVMSVNKDMAKILVNRASACGENCASCGSRCNTRSISLEVKNNLGAKPGDYVALKSHTNQILKSAAVVYLFPLLAMILGITIGINIFKSIGYTNYETYGFIMGLFFLGFSYIILGLIDKKIRSKTIIEMIRIINN